MTSEVVERQVAARAGERCEYCRMHQFLQGATFHVEHIYPTSLGGASTMDNLALACPGCNLCKSNRIELPDALTDSIVPLNNPRTDVWTDHFCWEGMKLIGRTPVGRALIEGFQLNSRRRLMIRQAEAVFGLFPPSGD